MIILKELDFPSFIGDGEQQKIIILMANFSNKFDKNDFENNNYQRMIMEKEIMELKAEVENIQNWGAELVKLLEDKIAEFIKSKNKFI